MATTDSVDVDGPVLHTTALGPGAGNSGEGSAPEIETAFDGATLFVNGTEGADHAVFGVDPDAGGIAGNLNAAEESGGNADSDIVAPNAVSIFYSGMAGPDAITGAGGGPLTSPLPASVSTTLDGGNGADVVEAGLGPSRLQGGYDFSDDDLRGGPNDDLLGASTGNGDLIGGGGTDVVEFLGVPGVTVDLRVTTPQVTGRGTKLIQGVEGVRGTLTRDVLIGDAAANALDGFTGRDAIQGLEGDDDLLGGSGRDLLDGGSGDDGADGGSGNDRVLGGTGDDRLRGSFDLDALFGGPGGDLLHARDPQPVLGEKRRGDRVINCGPGAGPTERAITDEADPEPRSC